MDKISFSFVLLLTLALVPLISKFAGRLDSLAVDFLGSAVSLLVTFSDVAYRGARDNAGVEVLIALIFIGGLTMCSICLALNSEVKKIRFQRRCEEGRWGGIYSELLYWINATLSVIFLTLALNMNLVSSSVIAEMHNEDETPFEFVRHLFSHQLGSLQPFYIGILVLTVCVISRYSYIPHEYLIRKTALQ